MFNVKCCKLHGRWSLKFLRGMLLNGHPGECLLFLRRTGRKGDSIFHWGGAGCDLHRNYGIVVILLSFLCNYDNLTLKLHQRKRCYPDKGWLFIGRFKKFEVCQEWALLLKHLKNPSWVWCEAINKVI